MMIKNYFLGICRKECERAGGHLSLKLKIWQRKVEIK